MRAPPGVTTLGTASTEKKGTGAAMRIEENIRSTGFWHVPGHARCAPVLHEAALVWGVGPLRRLSFGAKEQSLPTCYVAVAILE